MSGFLSADARVDVLNHLASEGAYIGLATALPSGTTDVTLANITECETAGYARTAVTWGAAAVKSGGVYGLDPIQLLNNADVNFPAVTEDMIPASYAFITDTASGSSIAAPVVTLGSVTAGAGTFTAGTYYWVVTALNAKGETLASNEVSATLIDNDEQALSWAAVSGAASYNVYRGTVAATENVLVTNVTGTSYTDTGSGGTSQTPPASSTAAIGKVFYVWELAEPVATLNGKPTMAPAGGLVVE